MLLSGNNAGAGSLSQLSELVRVFSPDTMVTALYGTLDPHSGCFEYALAAVVGKHDPTGRGRQRPRRSR